MRAKIEISDKVPFLSLEAENTQEDYFLSVFSLLVISSVESRPEKRNQKKLIIIRCQKDLRINNAVRIFRYRNYRS